MIENIKELVEKPHLSEEMIKELQLTEEEVKEYEDAMALVESIESISFDEMEKVMEKFYKLIPDDYEEGLKKFMEIAQKQPEFIKKVITFFEIFNEIEVLPEPTIEKVSTDDIKKDNFNEQMRPIYDFIYGKKDQ